LPQLMQAFAHYRRAGAKHGVDECFELLAQVNQQLGRAERAAWCWGVVQQLEQDTGKVLRPALKPVREAAWRALEGQLPGSAFETALAAGRRVPLDEALGEVLRDGRLGSPLSAAPQRR